MIVDTKNIFSHPGPKIILFFQFPPLLKSNQKKKKKKTCFENRITLRPTVIDNSRIRSKDENYPKNFKKEKLIFDLVLMFFRFWS